MSTENAHASLKLTESERKTLGFRVLDLQDGPARTKALLEVERLLGHWAEALMGHKDVMLESHVKAASKPLVDLARTMTLEVERLDSGVANWMLLLGSVDLPALARQLSLLEQFGDGLNRLPSKRGGERRAFDKQINNSWLVTAEDWLVRHLSARGLTADPARRRKFATIVKAAVKRTALASVHS